MEISTAAAIAATLEESLPPLEGGGLRIFEDEVRQVIDRILAHLNGEAKVVKASSAGFLTCRHNGRILVVLPAEGELAEAHNQPLPRLLYDTFRRGRLCLKPVYWWIGKLKLPVWRVGDHIVFVAPAPPPPQCRGEEEMLAEAKAEARKLLASAGIELPS
jgi:hypothetical protein